MAEGWEVEAHVSPIGDHDELSDIEETDKYNITEADDASDVLEDDESDEDEQNYVVLDFPSNDVDAIKELHKFRMRYRNVIDEFADVEIFLVSLDSLLVEFTAHEYLCWDLGCQTVVLANQIDTFLKQLSSLGGKFKLIWFTGLRPFYEKDNLLRFIRSFMDVHLLQSPWASDVVTFRDILDSEWNAFLDELTPSFLMTSVSSLSEQFSKEAEFSYLLAAAAISCLSYSIPVVLINGLVINMCSVMCHFIEPAICDPDKVGLFIRKLWKESKPIGKRLKNMAHCKNLAEFWVEVFMACRSGYDVEEFEKFASAVLVFALISGKLGVNRNYVPVAKNNRMSNNDEKMAILGVCADVLDTVDVQGHPLNFSFDDLWDGLFILGVYNEIMRRKKVLPFRLQEEFAELHSKMAMKLSLPIDMDERLFSPPDADNTEMASIANNLLVTECGLLKEYAPEYEQIFQKEARAEDPNLFGKFAKIVSCHVKYIPEKFEEQDKLDKYEARKKRINLQRLYRWYEVFAQSLEGRGTDLLVDFSRKPLHNFQKPNVKESSGTRQLANEKGKGKEVKAKKSSAKTKKEVILEANKNRRNAKVIEDERMKIAFAASQKTRAFFFLQELFNKLAMPESRARCVYEQACAVLREVEQVDGNENLEVRRVAAVPLVEKLKDLKLIYWNDLEEKPRNFVENTWKRLGFVKDGGVSGGYGAGISLEMGMLNYQLAYGGAIIDMESDPQEDGRVTGFCPDNWQRDLLKAVDERKSAVIIAPTSAGKTFISYYCIESILRTSDDDVVVYVSPSKALLNQVSGSVYARFRNKTMSDGKSLFGTLTADFAENPFNCQVLITMPDCFESMLLSCDPTTRQFVSKIKYTIFDEVHCISASPEAHIWEHLFLLIRCPFLALSATIGNVDALHTWLETTENLKTKRPRKVELIRYNERYSELELYLEDVRAAAAEKPTITGKSNFLKLFLPHAVFKPTKLSMFGIPDDQQLTAKQVLELYHAMADVDPVVKDTFEPCKFYHCEDGHDVWLTRKMLRKLEGGLKTTFMDWLKNDKEKLNRVLDNLRKDVDEELTYRSRTYDQLGAALNSIVNVVLELREKKQLPAICFIDNRSACLKLAKKLFQYLEKEEARFRATPEFKTNYEIKDEKKILKLMKRKRDAKEKKRGNKDTGEANSRGNKIDGDGDVDDIEEDDGDYLDRFSALHLKLKNVLARYRLHVRYYDEELVEQIKSRFEKEKRTQKEMTTLLLKLFDRGIAFHHEGLNSRQRTSIETLYRAGYLGMLFSTSTLALGINMPCKTVLFGMDTPLLTPLQFRQMAGRAGRRGFDHSGNVVFMSLPTSKMRRLLTASLSTLRGNFPFTVTYILRLFMFVYWTGEEEGKASEGTTGVERRMKAALALLKNPFVLYSHTENAAHKEQVRKSLEKQMKLHTLYSVQLLRWLGLLDDKGVPSGLAPVVTYLPEHEPGNLLFVYLLQKGVFHKLCGLSINGEDRKGLDDSPGEIKKKLIIIFANLFTNLRLPPHWNQEDETSYPSSTDSSVFLKGFPEDCKRHVEEYNAKVEELWRDNLTLIGTDDDLHIQKNIYALGRKPSFSLKSMFCDVVRPCDPKFLFDEQLFPACLDELTEYRGNKVCRNAYAYDFWVCRSKRLLLQANQIPEKDLWQLLQKFNSTLGRITTAMQAITYPTDHFRKMMEEVSSEYDTLFKRVFKMKMSVNYKAK